MTPSARLRFVAQNVRDLPRALTVSTLLSGIVLAIVVFSGPLFIIVQAASNANLDPQQTASWVWTVTVGSGIFTILMSLFYRQPVKVAWSTSGAALLTTSLVLYPYSEAIGAFIIAGIAAVVLGLTGWFGRLMALIPTPVVMGMLAGVLFRFGTGLFGALPENPLLVFLMILAYLLLRRFRFRAPTLGALAVGFAIAGVQGNLQLGGLTLTLTAPLLTAPQFSVQAILGLSLPLFLLAMTSQNAPGIAVLRAYQYQAPVNGILIFTGIASALLAPFGCHGLNLAAITAAMVAGPEAHPDPDLRYGAALSAGVWYTVLGLFGATAVAFFTSLPGALAATVAGLALAGTISASLADAVTDPKGREGGVLAFLCTAASFNLFNIGAPFWGLVFGMLAHFILTNPRLEAWRSRASS